MSKARTYSNQAIPAAGRPTQYHRAKPILTARHELRASDLAYQLGITSKDAASILRASGWTPTETPGLWQKPADWIHPPAPHIPHTWHAITFASIYAFSGTIAAILLSQSLGFL